MQGDFYRHIVCLTNQQHFNNHKNLNIYKTLIEKETLIDKQKCDSKSKESLFFLCVNINSADDLVIPTKKS